MKKYHEEIEYRLNEIQREVSEAIMCPPYEVREHIAKIKVLVMNDTKVFIIMGYSGLCDDHFSWINSVFTSKEEAEHKIYSLRNKVTEYKEKEENDVSFDPENSFKDLVDTNMLYWGDGPEYKIIEREISE